MRQKLREINFRFTSKKGQNIVEYVVLFTVVVGVIILAATSIIGPSVGRLYNRTADSLDHLNTEIP